MDKVKLIVLAINAADMSGRMVRDLCGVEASDLWDVVLPEKPAGDDFGTDVEELAKFTINAGVASGEALYRFASAKGFHHLPAGQFGEVAPMVRMFFETFAGVSLAIAKVIEPKPNEKPPIIPAPHRPALHDTIYERTGRGAERTGGPTLGRNEPRSTADVPITYAGDQTVKPGGVWEAGRPSAVFGPATAERPPTPAEFALMDPEERRKWGALYGFPTADDDMRVTSVAPPAAGFEKVVVNEPQYGDDGRGVVPVARARSFEANVERRGRPPILIGMDLGRSESDEQVPAPVPPPAGAVERPAGVAAATPAGKPKRKR